MSYRHANAVQSICLLALLVNAGGYRIPKARPARIFVAWHRILYVSRQGGEAKPDVRSLSRAALGVVVMGVERSNRANPKVKYTFYKPAASCRATNCQETVSTTWQTFSTRLWLVRENNFVMSHSGGKVRSRETNRIVRGAYRPGERRLLSEIETVACHRYSHTPKRPRRTVKPIRSCILAGSATPFRSELSMSI